MLLLDGRLDRLREEIATVRAPQFKRLVEQCDEYRRGTPPTEHPTASITYFGPAAANLALAYRLTGRAGYLEEAWRWISACIGFPHWGKAHMPDQDLDAGWLLHGLSLAHSWLDGDLGPERTRLLRDKLELQGQRLWSYTQKNRGTWWTDAYWQNHNWICWSGLATAGYALDRPQWSDAARANLEQVLTLLPEDGSDSEGVVYWRYGVPWLAIHTDLVQRCEGVDLWSSCDFLRHTTRWRLHQFAGGTFEENVDHGDCHDRRSGHSVALYHRLASAYRDGTAQWLGDLVAREHFWREAYASGVRPGVMPEAFLELLWYDPTVEATPPGAGTPTTAFFPDLGQLTARTGWHEQATAVSFKAAPGGGNRAWDEGERLRRDTGWNAASAGHHHPDAGSFVLTSHGSYLAVDEGYSNRKAAAHHNLVLVDGHGWADEGRYHVYDGIPYRRRPTMRDVLAEDGFAHATSETARMFPEDLGVTRLDRTLVMTPLGRVVIVDLMTARTPRSWTYVLHGDWPLHQADGHTWSLTAGAGQALLTALATPDAKSSTHVTEVEASPTSSTPSLKIVRRMHTLHLTSTPTAEAAFVTAFACASSLSPTPPTATAVDARHGWAVRIGEGAEAETVFLSPDRHRIEADGMSADAAAVILSGGRVAAVAARRVELDGVPVLHSSEGAPVSRVLPNPTVN